MRKGLITVEFGELVNLGKDKFNPMTNANMPCIELEHIDSGTGTINGSVDSSEQKSLKNVFHKGDILFSKLRPYLRKYWFADFDGVCSSEIWVLKPKEIVLPKYIFYLIQTEEFIRISNVSSGSKMPRADWDFINHYPLTIIHSLPKQHRIVSVLSLWDTAIAKQTALIEKLTLRKRGLMQQLLTGKKRLKGFGGEWKEVRLGEVGTAYGGLVNKNKEDFENGNALFITYMNVFSNGKIDINKLGQVRILPSEKQEQVQYGDIFFTVSSETPEEVGMASVLLNEAQNTYLNSFCFGYRLNDFKSIIPVYALYLFRGDDFRKKMNKIAQGSTRFNISKTEVLNMRITIPSIEEQNTIASVLVDADKEIEIHKQKLVVMQAQKRGLMQVLLTGKKRVK